MSNVQRRLILLLALGLSSNRLAEGAWPTEPPASCPAGGTECHLVAVAHVLGILGRPLRLDELHLPQNFSELDAGVALVALGKSLGDLGIESDLRVLSPRALRDTKQPAILGLRLPSGHSHFEVHLPGGVSHAKFADVNYGAHEDVTLRPYADLGDVWDGAALVILPPAGWSRGEKAALSVAGGLACAAAGWALASRIRRVGKATGRS